MYQFKKQAYNNTERVPSNSETSLNKAPFSILVEPPQMFNIARVWNSLQNPGAFYGFEDIVEHPY